MPLMSMETHENIRRELNRRELVLNDLRSVAGLNNNPMRVYLGDRAQDDQVIGLVRASLASHFLGLLYDVDDHIREMGVQPDLIPRELVDWLRANGVAE